LADHRVFAAVYDRLPASAEKGGLRQMRSDLLREARAVEIVDAPAEQLPSTTAASTRSYPRSCCATFTIQRGPPRR
jgi:hypothetical protein